MPNPVFDSADYELLWPRELFIRELIAMSTIINKYNHPNIWIECLLEEVFLGDTPVRDYKSSNTLDGYYYVDALLAYAPQLREYYQPRPYWSARHGVTTDGSRRNPDQLRGDFARLISSLQAHGYFDRALLRYCADHPGIDPDLEVLLVDRLGVPGTWLQKPNAWSDDLFYDLIEVFHDLVARPRSRACHYRDRDQDYSDFAMDIGRALYRWKVSTLLEAGGIELRLAEDGEDIGRLVHLVDNARTDLIERALASPDSGVANRVAHAIALFRRRGTTEHDKRSATITLAGVLEERRALIRAEIGQKDEGALFGLANKFALRHQRRNQQSDYDPAFLDWIFWWYLATIELTNRILARQHTDTAL